MFLSFFLRIMVGRRNWKKRANNIAGPPRRTGPGIIMLLLVIKKSRGWRIHGQFVRCPDRRFFFSPSSSSLFFFLFFLFCWSLILLYISKYDRKKKREVQNSVLNRIGSLHLPITTATRRSRRGSWGFGSPSNSSPGHSSSVLGTEPAVGLLRPAGDPHNLSDHDDVIVTIQ